MDIRIMLVEVRMRKAGTMGGSSAPKKKPVRPAKFGSEFERVLFDKPAVKALYEELQAAKDIDSMNLVSEHINNAKRAKDRYGNVPSYASTIKRVEEAGSPTRTWRRPRRPSINTTVWTWASAPPSSCRPCEQRSSLALHALHQHGTIRGRRYSSAEYYPRNPQ